jgi:hypothetical protein
MQCHYFEPTRTEGMFPKNKTTSPLKTSQTVKIRNDNTVMTTYRTTSFVGWQVKAGYPVTVKSTEPHVILMRNCNGRSTKCLTGERVNGNKHCASSGGHSLSWSNEISCLATQISPFTLVRLSASVIVNSARDRLSKSNRYISLR